METPPATYAIGEMVARIVTRFDPDQIILFGSHARGTAGPGSDVDLLVVMPVEGSSREQATEIDLALCDRELPLDLIVVTPEQFQRDRHRIGTIVEPAIREGRVLYARDSDHKLHGEESPAFANV